MERKQGFFSALREEVVRGLSPGRSRGRSPSPSRSSLRRRRKGAHTVPPEAFISRSGSLRPGVETLSPLREGPDPAGSEVGDSKSEKWGHWLCRAPSLSTSASGSGSGYQRSDLRLLLGVLGAPLAPVHVSSNDPLPHLSIKDTPIVSLSLLNIFPTALQCLLSYIFFFFFLGFFLKFFFFFLLLFLFLLFHVVGFYSLLGFVFVWFSG